jgi:hypothetical protein
MVRHQLLVVDLRSRGLFFAFSTSELQQIQSQSTLPSLGGPQQQIGIVAAGGGGGGREPIKSLRADMLCNYGQNKQRGKN